MIDLAGHENELEGYARFDDHLGIFITSSGKDNVTFGSVGNR